MPTGPFVKSMLLAFACLLCAYGQATLQSKDPQDNPCHRPSPGSIVPDPKDLRSRNGELSVDLRIHNYTGADGSTRYCYTTGDGTESPTLRLKPGDLLIL